jgi:hypothetical protein
MKLSNLATNILAAIVLGSPFFMVAVPYTVSWQNQQEAKR